MCSDNPNLPKEANKAKCRSAYAPKASPRVWPNERSRSRMGLVPGALYCRSAARAAERYSPAHLWARSATAPLCSSRARGH